MQSKGYITKKLCSFWPVFLFVFTLSCQNANTQQQAVTVVDITKGEEEVTERDTVENIPIPDLFQDSLKKVLAPLQALKQPVWLIELFDGQEGIEIELAYGTKKNFTGEALYPCQRCFLQKDAAKQLLDANQYFLKEYGYHIMIFDACRPLIFQELLWKKFPNPDYLANPKQISMHSRGLAVDITLVDSLGKEIDMGTPFDFFGKAAYHDYKALPDNIKENRRILKEGMRKHGFNAITSEWWHYYFRRAHGDPVSWVWGCDTMTNEGVFQ